MLHILRTFKHKKLLKTLVITALFAAGSQLWGEDYVYRSGQWYIYTGSQTECAAVSSDTTNQTVFGGTVNTLNTNNSRIYICDNLTVSEWSPQNSTTVKLASGQTLTFTGTNNIAGPFVNDGTIVTSGNLTFGALYSGNGNVTNSGALSFYQNLILNGQITNTSTGSINALTINIADSSAGIINQGTINSNETTSYGSITNSGTWEITNKLVNYGSVQNTGSLSASTSIENQDGASIINSGNLNSGNGVNNKGNIDSSTGIITGTLTNQGSGTSSGDSFAPGVIVWTGSVSSSLTDLNNWRNGISVPTVDEFLDATNLAVPGNSTRFPVFDSSSVDGSGNSVYTVNIKNITLKDGASLTARDSRQLDLYGAIICEGNAFVDLQDAILKVPVSETATWTADSPASSKFGTVLLEGTFRPAAEVNLYNNLTVTASGSYDAVTNSADTIIKNTLTITGTTFANTKFDTLKAALGNATLTISGQISVETLDLKGTSTTAKLAVEGGGSEIKLPETQFNGKFLSVSDTTAPSITNGTVAGGVQYYAYDSTLSGDIDVLNSLGWQAGDSSVFIWRGTSTAWNDGNNWSSGTVPGATDKVLILSNTTYYPVITAAQNISAGTLTMEGGAELTVNGSFSVGSNFTLNEKITGTGKLIVPAGKKYTVPEISVNIAIENNGTVDCGSNKVIFNKALQNNTGSTFILSSVSTVFFANADFTNATVQFDNNTKGDFHFYNKTSALNQSTITLNTPATPLTMGNFFFGGNVTINLKSTLTTDQFSMDARGVTEQFSTSNFTATVTGSALTCKSINLTRVSATAGVIGTLNISADITCSGEMQTHSGTTTIVAQGNKLNCNLFNYSADNTTPYSKLNIAGSMTAATFNMQNIRGSIETTIETTGTLTAGTIYKSTTSNFTPVAGQGNTGIAITNNGTINIETSLTMPSTFKLLNNGIIQDKDGSSGAAYSFAGTYDSNSTGTVKLNQGTLTNTTAAISGINLELTGNNTITGTQRITTGTITANSGSSLTVAGNVTLTDDLNIPSLTINTGANLTAAAGSTISGITSWTCNGTFTPGTSTVEFADAAEISGTSTFNNAVFTGDAAIYGSNTYGNFTASALAGKTIAFTAGTTQTVNKLFTASGTGPESANQLNLTSTGEWTIDLRGSTLNPFANVQYVNVTNSKSLTRTIKAVLSTDNSGNTNWDFTTEFTWTGNLSSDWETPGNWTPSNFGFPGVHAKVTIPDGCDNYPELTSTSYTIKTLTLSTVTADSPDAKITLESANIKITETAAGNFLNYGTVIFGGSGRILNNTDAPFMDTLHGTVQYGTSVSSTGTITDYNHVSDTANDYNNLVIAYGKWNLVEPSSESDDHIKANGTFVINSGATLTLNDTATVISKLTNNGTLEIAEDSGVALWNSFENNGTVTQKTNGTLWLANNCTNVTDKGIWTFATDANIYINQTGAAVSFTAASAATENNEYVIDIYSTTNKKISLAGFSSEKPMRIKRFTDNATTASYDFTDVKFLDDGDAGSSLIFNCAVTAASGDITFEDDVTFNKTTGTTLATAGTITVGSGKTLTSQGPFAIPNGTADLHGNVTINNADLTLKTVNIFDDVEIKAKGITITDSILPDEDETVSLTLTATNGIIAVSDNMELGSTTKKFTDITLTTTGNDITFGSTVKLNASGIITANGRNVTFDGIIVTNDMIISASNAAKITDLDAGSLTISGTPYVPSSVTFAGNVIIRNGDFIIDYPATVNGDVSFDIKAGNFILTDNLTYNTLGTLTPANTATTIAITAKADKEIQLYKDIGKTTPIFKSISFGSAVNFKTANKTLYGTTVVFKENSSLTAASNPFVIYSNFENATDFTYVDGYSFTIPGSLTILENAATTFNDGVSVAGNISDNGNDFTGDITFNGTSAQNFIPKNGTLYADLILDNSRTQLTISPANENETLTASKIEVKQAAALNINIPAEISDYSDTASSLALNINDNVQLSIISNTNSVLNTKALTIADDKTLLIGTSSSPENIVRPAGTTTTVTGTLKANDITLSTVTINGVVSAENNVTLNGTTTLSGQADAVVSVNIFNTLTTAAPTSAASLTLSAENYPNITAASIYTGESSTTADTVTVNGTKELLLNGQFTNNCSTTQSTSIKVSYAFTNNGTWINTSSTFTAQGNLINSSTGVVSQTGTGTTASFIVQADFSDEGTWNNRGTITLTENDGIQNFEPSSSTYNRITISKENGTVNFNTRAISATNLNDAATNDSAINFNAGGTITNAATFNTSKNLSITSVTDTLTFTNGVTHTAGQTVVDGLLSLGNNSTVSDITISSTGNLTGPSGKIITVKNSWTNENDSTGFTANNSTVSLVPAADEIRLNGSTTFYSLSATGLGGKTIIFEAGSKQTITNSLTLKGTSATNLLALTSDSETEIDSATESDCWYLELNPSSSTCSIQYVNLKNAYNDTKNAESETVYLTAQNSDDSGNNYYWNMPGVEYIWTGSASDDWNTRANWNRRSIPGSGAIVKINEVTSPAEYPLLTQMVSIGTGTVTVGADATFDIADQNVSAATITNNGTIRLNGTATQTISGTMVNGTGSTVEYYGGTSTTPSVKFVWDGNAAAAGNQYVNLVISGVMENTAAVTVSGTLNINDSANLSGAVNVTGTTTINNSGTVILNNNSNRFSSAISLPAANTSNVTLHTTAGLTLADKAAASSITISGPASIQNITTTGSQNFGGTVTLGSGNITLDAGSSTISFASTLTGNNTTNGNLTLNADTTHFGGAITKIAALTVSGQSEIYTTTVTTTDNQTFTGTVTAGPQNTTFTSAAGKLIKFESDISGSGETYNLTVTNAKAEFDGTVKDFGTVNCTSDADFYDDITAVSIAVTGNTEFKKTSDVQTVTTTTTQTYTGTVTVTDQNIIFDNTGLLWFKNTVSGTTDDTKNNFTVNGNIQLDADVSNFADIEIYGTAALRKTTGTQSISSTGKQTYSGAVTSAAQNITFSNADLLWFKNTVTGTSAAAKKNITIEGSVQFDGNVSNYAVLEAQDNAVLNTASITTTGTQTYSKTVTLKKSALLTGTTITFESTSDSTDEGQSLTITGNATFNGDAGSTKKLAALGVSGNTEISCSSISTTGNQTYTGSVTLNNDAQFSADSSSTIHFAKNIYGTDATITLSGGTTTLAASVEVQPAVNNKSALTCNDKVVFNNTYGSTDSAANTLNAGSGTITFTKNVDFSNTTLNHQNGTITFTPDEGQIITVTGSGSQVYNNVEIKGNITFTSGNTFANLTGTNLENITITFPAGTGNTQVITNTLKLTGKADEDDKRLILKSSSSTSATETDCFYINFTGTKSESGTINPLIQYVDMINGYNGTLKNTTEHVYLTLRNSQDSGNNYFWNFPGLVYLWTGSVSTDWFNKNNWNRKSVPGIGADVKINSQYNSTDITIWPLLDNTTFPAGTVKVSVGNIDENSDPMSGTITVGSNAVFDLGGESIITGSITNNGTVKLKGTATQTITGLMISGDDSLIEIYGGTSGATNFVWDNDSATEGYQITSLLISGSANISAIAHIEKTTVISTSENVSLTGSNIFTDKVTIEEGNDITLNSCETFTLEQDESAPLNSLTVMSKVILDSDITTVSFQNYNDELTLNKSLTLKETGSADADIITFGDAVNGTDYSLTIDGNTKFYSSEDVSVAYIKAANSKNVEWSSTSTANLKCDLYIDCAVNTLSINGNITASNIYAYNGTLSTNTGTILKTENDFVMWGGNYSATDKRFSASNSRFAYYTAPDFTYAYTITPDSATANFGTLNGSFEIGKNLYINGADVPASKFILPSSDTQRPELNTTGLSTENQWGLPYAIVFNSTLSNVTAQNRYITAAEAQGNTDGLLNTNVQFSVPEIQRAYTVYDDVIYVAFNIPLENSNNDINLNLSEGNSESYGSLNKGGLWYNNKTYRFAPTAYADADCTTPLSSQDLTTPDADGFYGFYLRTIHTDDNRESAFWNTDADGLNAYSTQVTSASDSTDRSGYHHNITVDLSMLEGMFSAAEGHTMSSNYGINYNAESTPASAYTATEDNCSPVLIGVYTGQENHETNVAAQPDYDAHNFIELRYSEPVNISDGTTNLNAADGDENIQATAALGNISGTGTGTGTTPAAGTGLVVAGLVELEGGKLNAGNKVTGTDSPHSLYRTFPVTAGGTAEKQTNRIRISIAGFVDGTINGAHKNWIGYIEYAATPAAGSNAQALLNANIKDLNGNTLDIYGSSENHALSNSFALNNGIPEETVNPIYGLWDTSAPEFSPIRKIKNNYASEYEIIPTGNGSVIDKIEVHILDGNYSSENTYFVFAHGWSEKLPEADANEYWYSLKPGFQAADNFGGSRAFVSDASRTGGGIRYSSLYNQYSAFKYGLSSGATPSLNFSSIKPGATSNYFYGTSDAATPIPTTDDNPYISLGIASSSYGYDIQFSVSYDNTNSYITDLAGNRLQSALLTTIDRTPPDYNLSLAPVGGNSSGKGEVYIVFAKNLKTEDVVVGSNSHNLVDILPQIIEFGTINGSFSQDTTLTVESAEPYKPLTVKGKTKDDKDFTAFKLTLSRAITLEDITTKYMRVTYIPSEGETAPDPFTLAAGSRVTYIQDSEGTSYLQMYKAHPLSDFAINVINPEYAYDPDYTADDASILMRNPENEQDSGNWTVHSWGQNQGTFGTLPYGDPINMIVNTTSDGDSDDTNDAGLPLTQKFTMYLSTNPTSASVSKQYNNDFSETKRIWLPAISGNSPFEPLADTLNTEFQTLTETAAPDFDTTKFPNRVQYNMDQSAFGWNPGDQIQFIFGVDGKSIMHSPSNSNDGSSYTGTLTPIFALRTDSILNPDILTLDLWSFKLKNFTTQRGGVSIFNNVINVYKAEKTIIKVNMAKTGNLKVIVMTLDGNVITYLENTSKTSGEHIYYWDGTNRRGNKVARGMYFIRVIGEGLDETRKVMCVNER